MKVYYCNCEKLCKGDRKLVSKASFFRHRKYREVYTHHFQDFLERHPVVVSEPGPSGHLTNSSETAHNTGSLSHCDRTTQVGGVVDRDVVDVSSICHWF
jgi:hypothetical protein